MRLGNTLFIHIPRTGGTHFEKLLGFEGHNSPPRCGSANYPVNHEEIMGWDRKLGVMLQHATYSEMIKHNLYSPEEKLITVSIVRDPYQRTVSLFKYYGGHKRWKSFNNFLKTLSSSLCTRYFYYPQHKYLLHNEELAIKNLIRFEHYEEDMKKFSDENDLNLEVAFNSVMQKEKTKKNLKKYYQDRPHNAKIVEKVYAGDFKLFNYSHLQIQ